MTFTNIRVVMPFLRLKPVTEASQKMKLDYSITSRLKRLVKFVHNSRRSLFHTERVLGARSRWKVTGSHVFNSSLRWMHKRLGVIS